MGPASDDDGYIVAAGFVSEQARDDSAWDGPGHIWALRMHVSTKEGLGLGEDLPRSIDD
jgi:hypothetical protein